MVGLNLKYAHLDETGWHRETVDETSHVGYCACLDLDTLDRPHISYYNSASHNLQYAFRSAAWISLTGELQAGVMVLGWTPVPSASEYWVYGADNRPHFMPGIAPDFEYRLAVLPGTTTTWQTTNGIGDPAYNWAYIILAADAAGLEIARSNRIGEFDFDASVP